MCQPPLVFRTVPADTLPPPIISLPPLRPAPLAPPYRRTVYLAEVVVTRTALAHFTSTVRSRPPTKVVVPERPIAPPPRSLAAPTQPPHLLNQSQDELDHAQPGRTRPQLASSAPSDSLSQPELEPQALTSSRPPHPPPRAHECARSSQGPHRESSLACSTTRLYQQRGVLGPLSFGLLSQAAELDLLLQHTPRPFQPPTPPPTTPATMSQPGDIQEKIAAARREAETLKEKIRAKRDQLADTSRECSSRLCQALGLGALVLPSAPARAQRLARQERAPR